MVCRNSIFARLKFKGLDVNKYNLWTMLFNSTIHAKLTRFWMFKVKETTLYFLWKLVLHGCLRLLSCDIWLTSIKSVTRLNAFSKRWNPYRVGVKSRHKSKSLWSLYSGLLLCGTLGDIKRIWCFKKQNKTQTLSFSD